jgi:hypothetical protein
MIDNTFDRTIADKYATYFANRAEKNVSKK